MAAKGVAAEQNDVDRQHDRADADAKEVLSGRRIGKPKRLPNVVARIDNENQREIKKIAMDVLHDEREGTFAQIGLARLAHRAGRRVGPECLVVGAPIIITGEPKPARRPENQERG